MYLGHIICIAYTFSALMLLDGRQEEHHPIKTELWVAGISGMVICLEQRADDLHMVQLMPLPLTPSSLLQ